MNEPSLVELLPRLFLAMAFVIVVMAGAARILRNKQLPGMPTLRPGTGQVKRENPVQLLARQSLGRNSSVAIVRAGNKTLVLGVSDSSISVLAELEEGALDSLVSVAPELSHQIQALPEVQRTDFGNGVAAIATPRPSGKGLLSQVREITVRKA